MAKRKSPKTATRKRRGVASEPTYSTNYDDELCRTLNDCRGFVAAIAAVLSDWPTVLGSVDDAKQLVDALASRIRIYDCLVSRNVDAETILHAIELGRAWGTLRSTLEHGDKIEYFKLFADAEKLRYEMESKFRHADKKNRTKSATDARVKKREANDKKIRAKVKEFRDAGEKNPREKTAEHLDIGIATVNRAFQPNRKA